jgi:hypothetical protein
MEVTNQFTTIKPTEKQETITIEGFDDDDEGYTIEDVGSKENKRSERRKKLDKIKMLQEERNRMKNIRTMETSGMNKEQLLDYVNTEIENQQTVWKKNFSELRREKDMLKMLVNDLKTENEDYVEQLTNVESEVDNVEKQMNDIFKYLETMDSKNTSLTESQIQKLSVLVKNIGGDYKDIAKSMKLYVRELSKRAQTEEIKTMITIAQDGMQKLLKGGLTLEEIKNMYNDMKNKTPSISETSMWKIIIGFVILVLLVSGLLIASNKVLPPLMKSVENNIGKEKAEIVSSVFNNVANKIKNTLLDIKREDQMVINKLREDSNMKLQQIQNETELKIKRKDAKLRNIISQLKKPKKK